MSNDHFPLGLASRSPRRFELLQQIGIEPYLISVDVPEVKGADEEPHVYVERLASDKARAGAVAAKKRLSCKAPPVILGADTIVVLNGQVLEKPDNEHHAVAMLTRLSNQWHQVLTAVSVCRTREAPLSPGDPAESPEIACRQKTVVSATKVKFRGISESEARQYWFSGEPKDKAGAYGIQGLGAIFVERIEGSYSGVVGLPLFETQTLLNAFGVKIWQSLVHE